MLRHVVRGFISHGTSFVCLPLPNLQRVAFPISSRIGVDDMARRGPLLKGQRAERAATSPRRLSVIVVCRNHLCCIRLARASSAVISPVCWRAIPLKLDDPSCAVQGDVSSPVFPALLQTAFLFYLPGIGATLTLFMINAVRRVRHLRFNLAFHFTPLPAVLCSRFGDPPPPLLPPDHLDPCPAPHLPPSPPAFHSRRRIFSPQILSTKAALPAVELGSSCPTSVPSALSAVPLLRWLCTSASTTATCTQGWCALCLGPAILLPDAVVSSPGPHGPAGVNNGHAIHPVKSTAHGSQARLQRSGAMRLAWSRRPFLSLQAEVMQTGLILVSALLYWVTRSNQSGGGLGYY